MACITPAQSTKKLTEWTFEEDARLQHLKSVHGRDWVKIALNMQGRTVQACISRFNLFLKDVNQGAWRPEEIQNLKHLVIKETGCRHTSWRNIARALKRTPGDCFNTFNLLQLTSNSLPENNFLHHSVYSQTPSVRHHPSQSGLPEYLS